MKAEEILKIINKCSTLNENHQIKYVDPIDYSKLANMLEEAIAVTRCSTQLPNIYEGTLNNDRIKIIRTLADNYNVSIDTIRSLFNDGADFYKQTLTK